MSTQVNIPFNTTTPPTSTPLYISRATFTAKGIEQLSRYTSEGIYTAHQFVWDLFDPVEDRKDRPFMFTPFKGSSFYIQSTEIPSDPHGYVKLLTKTIEQPTMHMGAGLDLRAWVNATVCTRDERIVPKGRSKRLGLQTYEKLMCEANGETPRDLDALLFEWLERRSEDGGFKLHRVTALTPVFSEQGVGRRNPITMDFVQLEARVEVTDPEKFVTLWRNGIGRGKAFGAGLVLLKPAAALVAL
jgi:CRISPR system Cascade subunit CasE